MKRIETIYIHTSVYVHGKCKVEAQKWINTFDYTKHLTVSVDLFNIKQQINIVVDIFNGHAHACLEMREPYPQYLN